MKKGEGERGDSPLEEHWVAGGGSSDRIATIECH